MAVLDGTLLTTGEAALRLGCTREQVVRLVLRGRVAGSFVAGRYLVEVGSLEAYVAQRDQAFAPMPAA